MKLAMFDLDNTILNGDSDKAWGNYLAEIGAVCATEQRAMQDHYYREYTSGKLDMYEFCAYQFKPLVDNTDEQLNDWRASFFTLKIMPMLTSGKADLVKRHREQGDYTAIVTATNRFIVEPVAEWLGVDTLLATEPERDQNGYTGNIAGIPCFQHGKVKKVEQWLNNTSMQFETTTYYGDSKNDIPLLEQVDTPVAVSPDGCLRRLAVKRQWLIID